MTALGLGLGFGFGRGAPRPSATPTYGHWVEIQLQPGQDINDMTDALDASANIVGAHRRWWWKEIETTEGNYVWTDVDAHLAACVARGKKLVILLMDKGFTYDGAQPLPADMQDGGANDITFEHVTGAYGAARWHTRWRSRIKNILQLIYQRYNGHPAFEGVALQETTLGDPTGVTVGGELYSRTAYEDAYIDVFTGTAVYRPRSWLYWYGTWFGPPGWSGGNNVDEQASMTRIRAACSPATRLCVGITNARLWDHADPSDATGWPNALKQRILDLPTPAGSIMGAWAADGFPVFAAAQSDDFQWAADSEHDPQRDLVYNYDRITRTTTQRGPGGDTGYADWCSAVKMFIWNYQKNAIGATFRQRFDASVADNTLYDAVSIINTEPRWWETPASLALSTYWFPDSTYLKYQGGTALAANGGEFTIVIWINMAGSVDGTLYNLLSIENASSAVRLKITRSTGNKITIQARNTSDADALAQASVKTSSSVLAASGWKCVMLSGKRATNTMQIYIGDTNEYAAGTWTDASADLWFADAFRVTFGASWSGANAMICHTAGAYVANWFTDLSQVKRRRAIMTATGGPVFAGHQGRRYDAADGVYNAAYRQPLLYIGHPDNAATINAGGAINRGSWESSGSWAKTGGTISAGSEIS